MKKRMLGTHQVTQWHSRYIVDFLWTRIFSRSMGGGPRTFRGGLNKWQWKRLHEKKAKEKETRLLEQEKQLYEARVRSEIRAKAWGKTEPEPSQYSPMSPQEHIKALADRFMKEGAEDLWNQDDGPIKSGEQQRSSPAGNNGPRFFSSPKLILGNNSLMGSQGNMDSTAVLGSNYVKNRNYSVLSRGKSCRNGSSSSGEDSYLDSRKDFVRKFMGYGVKSSNQRNGKDTVNELEFKVRKQNEFKRSESSSSEVDLDVKPVGAIERNLLHKKSGNEKIRQLSIQRRFRRNQSSSSDDDSEFDSEEQRGGWQDVRKMGSSASLGKYDMKITKRIPLKNVEEEIDFSEQVEMIRKELCSKSVQDERVPIDEGLIYSEKRFDECGISPLTIKALSAAGYVQMTRVQEATLSLCLDGKDNLVKAKTGTGKTAAFLVPAIEAALKATSENTNWQVLPVFVLILCPTRELASQLAAEAKALLRYHSGIGVQTLVGGTRFKVDQQRLEADPCQIIVATPGRLLDHIENKSRLSVRLMGLKMLILDEADHLLDLGFRKDLEKIVDCLPRQRQSMLFSATIPREVRRVSQLVLKREHVYIDTVGFGSAETHAKVRQYFLLAPHDTHFQMVYHLLKGHISQTIDYKVIVFCATGMVTSLLYLLLRELKMNVREINSRKPQLHRTSVSDEFREAKQLILVTSDVSARGMNYPDVTLVIQVGIPSSREQYIHRVGRTGRKGNEGEGILLLAPWEKYFLEELKDLPIEPLPMPLPNLDSEVKVQMDNSIGRIDTRVKEAAYHTWLGYYNSIREIGRDKTTLVELANQFCQSIGLQNPPPLFRKTALKMGLKDIPGIRIRK